MAKWFELPCDILERISSLCITHDHIRMQYVCKPWWSILKNTNRELPLLMMLPNDNEEDPVARDFFSLSKQKIHTVHLPEIRGKRCCGSFQNGWLMIVDENLDMFIFHPWSKRRIDLPHHSTFRGYSGEEIRVVGLLKAAVSDDGKVVLVAIAYRLGFLLAFCRIGDDVYTHIDIDQAIEDVEDVIYHKGNFYLFTGLASLYLLHIEEEEEDGSSPHIEKLTVGLGDDFIIPYKNFGYLVPDVLTDSMFVITRDVERIGEGDDFDPEEDVPHKTVHFNIFKVSLEESETLRTFEKVENLGDRVLFLGPNSPIVVMASQFPGFKGNRVYFADYKVERYYFADYKVERYCNSSHGCRDLGVFSLEDGTVEELFSERFHPSLSPPIWIATPPYSSSSKIFEESSYAYEVST